MASSMNEKPYNFETIWSQSQVVATERRAEVHRIANAMRRVIDYLVQVAAWQSPPR